MAQAGFAGVGSCGKRLDVGVAISAAEGAVNRSLEFGVVDVQADLLAVLVFGQSRIAVAGQALVVAHLGGRGRLGRLFGRRLGMKLRSRGCRHQQQGGEKNQTAALHRSPRYRPGETHTGEHSNIAESGTFGQ